MAYSETEANLLRDVEQAVKASIRNRKAVLSAECGCYQCCRTFNGKDVSDWTDEGQTALCPHCGVDSVLPGETDTGFLERACRRWFTGGPMTNQVTRTAPERIWLQVSDDADDARESFPDDWGYWGYDGVTWCANKIGGCEVEYVRADLAKKGDRDGR